MKSLNKIILPVAVSLSSILSGCSSVGLRSPSPYFGNHQEETKTNIEYPTQAPKEASKLPKKSSKTKLNHKSLVDKHGYNSQTSFVHETDSDKPTKTQLLHETFQNDDSNTGLDIANEDFRLNLGYGLREFGENPYRVLFTKKFDEGFFGAKYQSLPDQDYFSVHGGINIDENNSLEATVGNTGTSAVFFHTLENGSMVGIGGGLSDDNDYDLNLSFSNDKMFAYARYFENGSSDLRIAFGDINPKKAQYLMSVTGSGWNERDDFFDDKTFRFGIGENGRTWLPFYDTESYLGDEIGDRALHMRVINENRAIAEVAYRPIQNLVLTSGVRAELQPSSSYNSENFGVVQRVQYDIGNIFGLEKDALNVYANGYLNNEGEVQSAGGFSFSRSW